ncbi:MULTISPECIES: T9SS type A sorting domain-containing protein [unclassified Lentimicrobium]|uniref:T9SS type A sorting domain-containing protein n=1 Tax=unclassified Lentimicrobium TaxID=2677434 RepID=UPI0015566DC5|nr:MULTISPECIES: T9SS type A sorting domain-containing protein [unclassified Lentimicrobium]NPD48091.1 T9SS type A sorting domain-containing protein [Lentimicrobium sp. S6]NPD85077.1 T9SS type A sorting domain-containing protein [Lentimicrobium sp. L6]
MTNSTKYYLFIFSVLILLISKTAHSQSLELYHNDILVNNDTILMEGDVIADSLHTYVFQGDTTYYYAYEVDIDIDVKNMSNAPMGVHTKKTHLKIIAGTENYFCWETCYAPYTFESVHAIEISGNEIIDIYSAHYKPKGQLGNIMVAYTFFDELNPNDSATVTVEYSMDEASYIVENHQAENLFSDVFPNPSINTISIDIKEASSDKYKLKVFDLTGRKIQEKVFGQGQTILKMDIEGLYGGTYIYSISSEGNILKSGKFFKLP